MAEPKKAAPKKVKAEKPKVVEPEPLSYKVVHEVAHVLAYPEHYTLGEIAKAQEALRELL